MSGARIIIRDVTFLDMENHRVLGPLSLTIEPNDWVGIVGPNNSGKSLLAHLLSGQAIPSTGEIWVDHRCTREDKERRAIRVHAVYLTSDPENQFVAVTVFDEITFALQVMGLPAATILQRTEEALNLFNLEALRHVHPFFLSTGEKFRLLLAAAYVRRPTLLILDDITSMMDGTTRLHIDALLQKWRAECGITLIMLSHRLEDLHSAERILVMRNGRVECDESTAAVWEIANEGRWEDIQTPAVYQLYRKLPLTLRERWQNWEEVLPAILEAYEL